MKVTYIVHNYAGKKGDDRTSTVTGDIARLVMSYKNAQKENGITILEVEDGEPAKVLKDRRLEGNDGSPA